MKRLRKAFVAVVVLGSTLALHPAGADEPKTHVIQVGMPSSTNPQAPFTYTRFLPDILQVHRGDLVIWQFHKSYNAWHSVSFGFDPAESTGMTMDDVPGHQKYADDILFGTQPRQGNGSDGCGRRSYYNEKDLAPCVLKSRDQALGSAVFDQFFAMTRAAQFAVRIDENAELGDYKYLCTLHAVEGKEMTGMIRVVADSEPLQNMTSEEIQAAVDADYEEAVRVRNEKAATAYNPVSGEWNVWTGLTTGHVDVLDFVPSHVSLRRGESIRFIAGTSEPNTVTFPGETGGSFGCAGSNCSGAPPYGFGFVSQPWACDPDDEGPFPSTFFTLGLPRLKDRSDAAPGYGCPSGWWREFHVGPLSSGPIRAPGDLVTPGALHTSGVMFSEDSPDSFRRKGDGTYFLSEFSAKFPVQTASPIAFVCYAHPDQMKGSVQVI